MFDRLIESDSVQAEFKPRRKFFMVSSVVVGILFLTAVVASLYAHDLDLGTDSFEIAEIIAPVADTPEPEPPKPQQQQRQNDDRPVTELPNRQELIARPDQTPPKVPDKISTDVFKGLTVPDGIFTNDRSRPDSTGTGSSSSTSESTGPEVAATEPTEVKVPPPAAPKAEPKIPRTKTGGVMNGYATSLPKPAYPAIAKQMNLPIVVVNVQVLINEQGDVVSAKAIDGHPFFKQPAERSAMQAKFKPTLLSNQPVKVNGIIVYKFTH